MRAKNDPKCGNEMPALWGFVGWWLMVGRSSYVMGNPRVDQDYVYNNIQQ